jgi:hypothetical protein
VYVRPRYRSPEPSAGTETAPPTTATQQIQRRSHIAVVPAVILLAVGWYLAQYSVVFPAILGFFLLSGALGLLGSRMNPLSSAFYLTTKPSWTAIGTAFLAGALLLWMTYEYYVHAWGPLIPRIPAL